VGGDREVEADMRILAATKQELEKLIATLAAKHLPDRKQFGLR